MAAGHAEGPWGTGSHAGALRAPQADSVGCGGNPRHQDVPGVPQWIVDSITSTILFDHGGQFCDGDVGEVLRNLADQAGVDYRRTSTAVQRMELMGWLYVERENPIVGSRKRNKIIRIAII